jgi:uncharacterized membrane protein
MVVCYPRHGRQVGGAAVAATARTVGVSVAQHCAAANLRLLSCTSAPSCGTHESILLSSAMAMAVATAVVVVVVWSKEHVQEM